MTIASRHFNGTGIFKGGTEMYIGQLGHGSDSKDGIYTLLKGVLVMAMNEF